MDDTANPDTLITPTDPVPEPLRGWHEPPDLALEAADPTAAHERTRNRYIAVAEAGNTLDPEPAGLSQPSPEALCQALQRWFREHLRPGEPRHAWLYAIRQTRTGTGEPWLATSTTYIGEVMVDGSGETVAHSESDWVHELTAHSWRLSWNVRIRKRGRPKRTETEQCG